MVLSNVFHISYRSHFGVVVVFLWGNLLIKILKPFLLSLPKTESESESGSHKNVRVRGKPPGSSDGKTRVRTVLNEKQLHTLR